MAVESAAFDYRDELRRLVSERTVELLERRGAAPSYRRRGWLVRRALVGADVAGLVIAFAASESLYRLGNGGTVDAVREPLLFLAALPVWVLVAKIYGLYERDEEQTDHSTADDFAGVIHTVTMGAWALGAVVWLTGVAHPPYGKLIIFWATAVVAICGCRAGARAICRRHVLYLQNAVILGCGEIGQVVAQKLRNHPEYGINLVGFVDTDDLPRNAEDDSVAYLGPPERLDVLVALLDIERVIVAYPQMSRDDTSELMRALGEAGVQVDIVPRFHDLITRGLSIHTVEGLPLIGLPAPSLSRSSLFVKRVFDVGVAGVALVLLSPLFAYVAVRIKAGSRGPVFFRQERMGQGERPFRIFKFRTMVADADERKAELTDVNEYRLRLSSGPMFKVRDDPRVTRFGRVLRRHFLDELPQLLNVVRGEMSLVGPRPLIVEEANHVNAWGKRRLALKPGMTGIWQVLGRNAIDFDEMVSLDWGYVSTWSLWEDVKLVFRTLPLVIRGGGKGM